MIVASNILMFLLERNNYKSKEDALFALEMVTFPKRVQIVLSPVIIVKSWTSLQKYLSTKFEISDESDNKKTSVNPSLADTDQLAQSNEKNSESAAVVSNALLAGGERVLLQTAQVVVRGKDGVQCQARILMESASH